MRTAKVKCDTLTLDPVNARTHDKRNIEAIKASLLKFQQQKPIVVDADNVVRAGNGTLIAARELGWDTISVVRTTLAEAEALAYAIADNRTAELAAWDAEALVAAMASIEDPELRGAVGFTAKEMDALAMSVRGPVEEDEVPEPPKKPVTKPGDVWTLGKHRVVCGDALIHAVPGKPQLMVTDPPYGVEYKGGSGNQRKRQGLQGDDAPSLYTGVMGRAAQFLAPDAAVYVWFAGRHADVAVGAVRGSGFDVRSVLIWNKQNPHYGGFTAHYLQKHELCVYGVRRNVEWVGPTNEVSVWDIQQPRVNEHHPTQKPVECMARPISNHHAAVVCDPFLGSGTTLIACEQLDRVCYGIEIEPRYVDVTVERWQNLTGKKAKRGKV